LLAGDMPIGAPELIVLVVLGFLVILPLLIIIWVMVTYNRLVRGRNQLREGWSGIEVQLKRRHDLVPALVECVKGYQTHEREALEAIIQARGEPTEEQRFGRDLGRVIALAESYPELKADQQFLKLMKELVSVEDQLQYARRYYNGSARELNNRVETFPSNLVARLAGFSTIPYFEVERASDRLAPDLAKQLREQA
jgi:LemA protein